MDMTIVSFADSKVKFTLHSTHSHHHRIGLSTISHFFPQNTTHIVDMIMTKGNERMEHHIMYQSPEQHSDPPKLISFLHHEENKKKKKKTRYSLKNYNMSRN